MEYLTLVVITVAVAISLATQNVAVGKKDENPAPRAQCNGVAPKDPAEYRSRAEEVMTRLVKTTPLLTKRVYKAWEPDQRIGSVTGAATCYSNSVSKCRACLAKVKASLTAGPRCNVSTSGACFASLCNMEFWQVFD